MSYADSGGLGQLGETASAISYPETWKENINPMSFTEEDIENAEKEGDSAFLNIVQVHARLTAQIEEQYASGKYSKAQAEYYRTSLDQVERLIGEGDYENAQVYIQQIASAMATHHVGPGSTMRKLGLAPTFAAAAVGAGVLLAVLFYKRR